MLEQTILTADPDVDLVVETDNVIAGSTSTSQTDTRIHTVPRLEQPDPLKWEIEARVLAAQSDDIIAGHLGIPVDDVADYVANHFDFRADLDHDSQLFLNAVQGPLTPGEELTEGDTWRLVAWLYGPVGLDLIIDDYHGRTAPENTEATVLADLLRAQAIVRFVNPRSHAYADALRQTRKHYRRSRDTSAKQIVAYCNALLVIAGWDPKGKGRLDSKVRRKAIDQLTDEQLADQIQQAWHKIEGTR